MIRQETSQNNEVHQIRPEPAPGSSTPQDEELLSDFPEQDAQATKLNSRDVPNLFYHSKQSYVDELSGEDHVNMVLVEFLEAIARLADKVGEAAGLHPMVKRNKEILE